ncbi:MAG: hypothetical protein JKY22_11940 [Flavobacteriaceae bacterium]|nr:hypothetical protein [Flavobacteriaceae bacterium]
MFDNVPDNTLSDIPNPQSGMMIYNNSNSQFEWHNGVNWSSFGGGGGDNVYSIDGTLTNNRIIDISNFSFNIFDGVHNLLSLGSAVNKFRSPLSVGDFSTVELYTTAAVMKASNNASRIIATTAGSAAAPSSLPDPYVGMEKITGASDHKGFMVDTNGKLYIRANGYENAATGNTILKTDIIGEIVYSDYNLPEIDGSTGQVLSTDGLGNVSWGDNTPTAGLWADATPDNWIYRNGPVSISNDDPFSFLYDLFVEGVNGLGTTSVTVNNSVITGQSSVNISANGNSPISIISFGSSSGGTTFGSGSSGTSLINGGAFLNLQANTEIKFGSSSSTQPELIIKKDSVIINGIVIDGDGDTATVNQVLGNIDGILNWVDGGSNQLKTTFDSYSEVRGYDHNNSGNSIVIKDETYTFNSISYITIGGVFYRSATGTENGSTVIVASDATIWKRTAIDNTFIPEWFRVGGYDVDGTNYVDKLTSPDGIYNDCDRVIGCSILANEKGTIHLGTIINQYDIDINVPIFKDQIWNMNGVNLDRMDSPSVTGSSNTSTVVTLGTADSGFRVGQFIVLLDPSAPNGGQGDGENSHSLTSTSSQTITNVSGTTITVNGASGGFGANIANGIAMVESITFGIQVGDFGNITINNGYFDGNATNGGVVLFTSPKGFQSGFSGDWRYSYSILLGSSTNDASITNCFVYDTPSECISFASGLVDETRYQNLGGSFVHASSGVDTINGITLRNCKGNGSNQVGDDIMGHSEAVLTFSANPHNAKIINCVFSNGEESIIGNNNSTLGVKGGDIHVSGSNFTNFKYLFLSTTSTSSEENGDIYFYKNFFYNCGDTYIVGNTTNDINNIVFDHNYFNHTRFAFSKADGLRFTHNMIDTIETGESYTLSPLTGSQVNKHQFIISESNNTLIMGNSFMGRKLYDAECQGGITYQIFNTGHPDDDDFIKYQNIRIKDNLVENYYKGIAGTGSTYFAGLQREHVGWEFSGNIIKMSKDAAGIPLNYGSGIEAYAGMVVRDNTIFQGNKSSGTHNPIAAHGIHDALDGDNERQRLVGAIIENNTIYSNLSLGLPRSIFVGANGNSSNNQYNVTVKGNRIGAVITAGAIQFASGFIINNNLINSTNLIELTNRSTPVW